jgi:hypothetical protein
MRDILIIIPTRSSGGTRVASLRRLIESWRKTTEGYSDLMTVTDEDDHHHYKDVLPPMGHAIIMPQAHLVKKLNLAAMAILNEYRIICFVGDDVVFQTPGWEKQIVDHMKVNSPCVAYCNDLLQGENLPNNVFLSSEIVEALGYMCPPELKHYYIDNFWKDLGIRLGHRGLKYFPDIVIEHMHWSNGKMEKDQLYTESERMMGEDRQAFDKYRIERFDSDIQKIVKHHMDKIRENLSFEE